MGRLSKKGNAPKTKPNCSARIKKESLSFSRQTSLEKASPRACELAKQSIMGTRRSYNKKRGLLKSNPLLKKRRRHTLPHNDAVPSAQSGLTSMFGMERGEHRRYKHLKLFV